MNFVILGDGPDEHAWSLAVDAHPDHAVVAAHPGLPARPEVPAYRDFEAALIAPDVDAALVGGPPDARAEALRRVAAAGLPAICLHPPGPDSEPYYLVAMSRAETGSILVPDLSERLHPGVEAVRRALQANTLGPARSLRYEATLDDGSDLARSAFARAVDLARSLFGEVEAVSASGDTVGERPTEHLVVQLRFPHSRRAEIRLAAGPFDPPRLTLTGPGGALTLAWPTDPDAPTLLDGPGTHHEYDPWDHRSALLDVLGSAVQGRPVHPDLLDATRAMEVSEAVVRGLRRGRTVEMHYEEISEAGTFKSVMTSVGCMILLSILVVVPLALSGPALGLPWTIYLAYAIPPALILFVALQFLRFAVRGQASPPSKAEPR